MTTKQLIADLVAKAMRTRYAGASVAERVSLITGEQKESVRRLLLRSFKKGEAMDVTVGRVRRFYDGVAGNGGPSYMARRLVVSELTRFNGRVAVEMGAQIQEDTGRAPIYTYQTQQDDRVRDAHAEAQDEEFTLDELADQLGLRPVSEAEALLAEPNCRCWLDVSYEGASKPGATTEAASDERRTKGADAPVDQPGGEERLRQKIEDAVRGGDYSGLVGDIRDAFNLG